MDAWMLGCLDAYEVKVNTDIFKYQEKVKLISQYQSFFFIFQWIIRVYFIPIKYLLKYFEVFAWDLDRIKL